MKNTKTSLTSVLISSQQLEDSVGERLEFAIPSFTERYVLLKGYIWYKFKNKDTGEIRTSYGEMLSFSPNEEELYKEGGGGLWFCDSKARKTSLLVKQTEQSECYPGWSPTADDILIQDSASLDFRYELESKKVEVLRLPSKKRLTYGPFKNLSISTWAADGKGILLSIDTGKKSTVKLQELTGKLTKLFTWPRTINAIVQSPRKSEFLILDESGIYITSKDAKHTTKIPLIPYEEEKWYDWKFVFSPSGKKLAIFSDVCSGNPHYFHDYTLYILDTVSRKLSKNRWSWQASFLGEEDAYARYLEGWTKDDTTVRISAYIDYSPTKPLETANDWMKFWKLDITKSSNTPEEVFDSGKRCLGAYWRSSK